jgi:hypothetical protein
MDLITMITLLTNLFSKTPELVDGDKCDQQSKINFDVVPDEILQLILSFTTNIDNTYLNVSLEGFIEADREDIVDLQAIS